jgi:protein-disulfide isomerase
MRRQEPHDMSNATLNPPVGPQDHVQGAAHAPVTLVEYGDFECGHCGRAHPVVQELQRQLGDALRFVYRSFPLKQAHPHAEHAAEAAESVATHGGEDAFWEMHDLLYENQEALEDEDLLAYAASTGVDEQVVGSDLASGAMATRVHQDFRSGVRSGVNGTPTFFVNGRRYDGDWTDAEAFAADLHALARATPAR